MFNNFILATHFISLFLSVRVYNLVLFKFGSLNAKCHSSIVCCVTGCGRDGPGIHCIYSGHCGAARSPILGCYIFPHVVGTGPGLTDRYSGGHALHDLRYRHLQEDSQTICDRCVGYHVHKKFKYSAV